MSLIKINSLTFSYPTSSNNVFENVNLHIDTNWKLGLIGRNGVGKTTFLNLLLGKYPYQGSIVTSVKFDYFPFNITDNSKLTIEIVQEICNNAETWQILKEFYLLKLDEGILYSPFNILSNGEQTKVLLVALFLNNNHFLLIDEPTNHLDYKSREIVASYLKNKKGFILVSHDRHFLDSCIDHILSINKSNIEICNGNYSAWKSNFDNQQRFELNKNNQLQKEINNLKKSAMNTAIWSQKIEDKKYGNGPVDRGYIGHKSAKMMKRSKVIENHRLRAIEEKESLLKNYENIEDIKLCTLKFHKNLLVSFKDVVPIFLKDKIKNPITFEIHQGDKIALIGKNGSGKSSLIKLLINSNLDYYGSIIKSSGLIISYIPQDASTLDGYLNDFAKNSNIDECLFKSMLIKLGFSRSQFDLSIKHFSAGQKKKILIAKSLSQKAHLYIWDEPLNYIDIASRIQIENLIKTFSPTLLFVEHDSSFINCIATKIIKIE